jgi:hypothetical protein
MYEKEIYLVGQECRYLKDGNLLNTAQSLDEEVRDG